VQCEIEVPRYGDVKIISYVVGAGDSTSGLKFGLDNISFSATNFFAVQTM
jgi:hypothetical protein